MKKPMSKPLNKARNPRKCDNQRYRSARRFCMHLNALENTSGKDSVQRRWQMRSPSAAVELSLWIQFWTISSPVQNLLSNSKHVSLMNWRVKGRWSFQRWPISEGCTTHILLHQGVLEVIERISGLYNKLDWPTDASNQCLYLPT